MTVALNSESLASTKANSSAGNTALVLGATGGLGKAYCKALASRQFNLVISGRNAMALDVLATELGSEHGVAVNTLVADLCNASDCSRVLALLEQNAKINWLVNSAGVAHWGKFMELSLASQQELFQVNLLTPLELLRSAAEAFRRRGGGTIVHVASAAAFFSVPFLSSYCASKGAVVQAMTSIREEIRGDGVCLQALCPGFVKTEMFARAGADSDRLPSWIWMSPDRIARESIRAVELNRSVCIPGKRYHLMLFAMRWLPAQISRRVAGWLFGNFSKYRISTR